MTNPIIEEVRAARAAIAAEHGYDRAKILAWARAEQASRKAAAGLPTPDAANAAGRAGEEPSAAPSVEERQRNRAKLREI